MTDHSNKDGFKSNLGSILALAGSAVGLGNIWRFPYMVAENGGSAFILIYIIMVFAICVPAFMAEVAIGRNTGLNIFGAFRKLAPKGWWFQIGTLGILGSFVISSFYIVIGGWTLAFLARSIVGSFNGMNASDVSVLFANFVDTPIETSAWALGFVVISVAVLISGVAKGIERFNKILMPMLLGLMIIMAINSLFLSHFWEGMKFLFQPDFSHVNTHTVISALGQAFFSMSLGMGSIITYGSYMRKQDNIMKSTFSVATIGILISVLAGIIIFPAVFSFDIPAEAGDRLAFVTFPAIFQVMPGGYLFGIMFFMLLLVAAVTSNISLLEVIVAYLTQEYKMKRGIALAIVVAVLSVTGTLCAFSLSSDTSLIIGGRSLFDLFNYFSAAYLLPICGLLISIFVGWKWNKNSLKQEISSNGLYPVRYFPFFRFMLRFIIPIFIIFVFLYALGIM